MPLWRSAACTAGQSGSGRTTVEGGVGGNSRPSSWSWSAPSGNGQLNLASFARRKHSPTVVGDAPTERAISRWLSPAW